LWDEVRAMKSFGWRSILLVAAAFVIPACGKDHSKSSSSGGGTPPPGGNPPPSTLAAPTNIQAAPGDRMITLTWDAVPGATGYTIRSATDQGGPYGLVELNFAGTMFIDDTLDNGTTYYYVITTMNAAGEGPPSAEVSATPAGTAPPTQTWTKDPTNPVLAGASNAGGWDQAGAQDPSVIRVGAEWVMYYTGGSASAGLPGIGRATSSDGVTWIRTGTGPVLTPGAAGTWDGGSVTQPHVVFDGSAFRMWYTGEASGFAPQIGYATSTDGITWTRSPAPVLTAGASGSWDDFSVSDPNVLLDGGSYRMWYTGADGTGNTAVRQVGYAESTDGTTWSKYPSPVLTPSAGTFDERWTSGLNVVRDASGLRGWYTGSSGVGGGITHRIGFATSADGLAWTKQPSPPQPVLTVGAAGAWDDVDVTSPSVAPDGAGLRMWYAGRDQATATWAIGTATSP
jgi:predicted GH43/DUF377 family glycosyl hydrolase